MVFFFLLLSFASHASKCDYTTRDGFQQTHWNSYMQKKGHLSIETSYVIAKDVKPLRNCIHIWFLNYKSKLRLILSFCRPQEIINRLDD